MSQHQFPNPTDSSTACSFGIARGLRTLTFASLLATTIATTAAGAQESPMPQPPNQRLGTSRQSSSSSPQPLTLPNAPIPAAPRKQLQAYSGIVLGTFCGAGASYSSAATKPTVGCGFGGDLLLIPVFFEFGVMGPQANRSYVSGYMSIDAKIPLRNIDSKYLPLLIGGYTRFFETGHSLDYGVALAIPGKSVSGEGRSVQIELRDYWTFANPNQHNVMLRVGWLVGASD